MSLVLKYFKRKLKPFKKCVDAQSKSFDNELENNDHKVSAAKQKKPSYFKLIKRKKKSDDNKNNRESVESGINSNYSTIDNNNSSFNNDAEVERKSLSRHLQKHHQLFNTPVSSVLSIDHDDPAQSQTKRFKLDDLTSDNSCYNNNVVTTVSYEEDEQHNTNSSCFMTTGSSIINSTPTNSYTSSMVTYNTKYNANSNLMMDDDGLLSVSQQQNEQQSTPAFTENFAKIKSLKNANSLKKCRRSNTTYTIAGSKCNNYIIDYFDKLELIKPINSHNNAKQQKQAVIRKLNNESPQLKEVVQNKKSKKTNEQNVTSESINCKNEVEKIQDVLFYDEPSLLNNTNTNNTFDTNEMSLNNNAGSQNEPALLDSTNEGSNSIQYDDSPKSLRKTNDSKSTSKLNNDDLGSGGNDISIENLRRSLSFPVLNSGNGSPISQSNVSKISIVKQESSPPKVKDEQKQAAAAAAASNFLRGDPQTRLSTNIKKMFKNVVKYQMNALNNLEQFYESQVSKLETERKRNLSIIGNGNSVEKINQYFDAQIKQLEERVQQNLKLICENRQNETVVEPAKPAISNKTLLSRRLSQIMLLKQLEKSNNNNTNNRLSRGNLKANLLAMNQNNILPSKKLRNQSSGNGSSTQVKQQQKTTEFTESVDLKETIFKRNLSLPYYQCSNKQNAALLLSKQLTERINSNNNLRMARKLEQQQQQQRRSSTQLSALRGQQRELSSSSSNAAGLRANHNIMVNMKVLAAAVAQNQYQKNASIRKQSASNENISKMVLLTNSTSNDKFTKLINQRQNKSACSLQKSSEDLMTMNGGGDFSVTTLSKSNCSLFSNNNNHTIFDNISSSTNNSSHLIKYQPPRYSDSHMQFKLNQQKLALIKSAQEFSSKSKNNNTSSSLSPPIESKQMNSTNNNTVAATMNFLIETEV